MNDVHPTRYVVWLYGGLFKPGAQCAPDHGYPMTEIEAFSMGEAARKYVHAHGLRESVNRHAQSERAFWVAVACREPRPDRDDVIGRFKITITLQTEDVTIESKP